MNAAKQLFDYLGNPRGQLVIYMSGSAESEKQLIVWARHGYDRRNIPPSFEGHKVVVRDMPCVTGHADKSTRFAIH